jgi:hypothetical protein
MNETKNENRAKVNSAPTAPDFERLANDLNGAQTLLSEQMATLQDLIEKLEAQHLPHLRRLADTVARRKVELLDAVSSHAECFRDPKSRALHGWRFGFRKQPGALEITDEADTIRRLRKLLGEDAAAYIRVKESLDKHLLKALPAGDLAKAGITLTADTDAPFVAPCAGDISKLVEALLERAEKRAAAKGN